MTRLKAFAPVFGRILSTSSSVASLLGLVFSLNGDKPWTFVMWGLLACSCATFMWTIVSEVNGIRSIHVYRNADKAKVRDYMSQWITHGGRIAIWTRDHSWIDDDQVRQLLRMKAKQGELILCLPAHTLFTQELAGHGAEIVAYGRATGVPSVRFTITNFERDGSAVAIGRPSPELHVIEEYSPHHGNGNAIAFHLAYDLVRLARQSAVKPL